MSADDKGFTEQQNIANQMDGRITDSAQEETNRINNIFAKAKFDGIEDQLVNSGKSGGTDAVKAKISEIDGLQEAFYMVDEVLDSIFVFEGYITCILVVEGV